MRARQLVARAGSRAGTSGPRHAGDFTTESHTRASSLGKLSAGFGEPFSYKGEPARGSCREVRWPEQSAGARLVGPSGANHSIRITNPGLPAKTMRKLALNMESIYRLCCGKAFRAWAVMFGPEAAGEKHVTSGTG